MNIAVSQEQGRRLVCVDGEVDLDTSPALWTKLQSELRGAKSVVVDLSAVSYIDSSGVAVLIQGLKHAQKNGGRFALRSPSARVQSVLEMAQLSRLFEIEDGKA